MSEPTNNAVKEILRIPSIQFNVTISPSFQIVCHVFGSAQGLDPDLIGATSLLTHRLHRYMKAL
jgi:hypothetical protein